jgi:hypothetical protein
MSENRYFRSESDIESFLLRERLGALVTLP